MDRDVINGLFDIMPIISVIVRVAHSVDSVRKWCDENIPEELLPTLTARPTNGDEYIIRAVFADKHYAALFRIFWAGNS